MKRIMAALMFFTRLPLWRVVRVNPEFFSRVVPLWPVAGWVTGGVMALTFYICAIIFPLWIAAALALASRLLLTGALHDDGLADFIDGFGCGGSRERILAVMKDSHIGTYGVISLIFLYLLSTWAAVTVAVSGGVALGCAVLFAADIWSKFCASQIVNVLPYARTAEGAKNLTVYIRTPLPEWLLSLLSGAWPLPVLCIGFGAPAKLLAAAAAPAITSALLFLIFRKKIGGYTGDCCGATFLLSELSFMLAATALLR